MDAGDPLVSAQSMAEATVVAAIIRDFIHLTERLAGPALAQLMNNYYGKVMALVEQQQGMLCSLDNHGMLIVFPPVPGGDPHARRALRFALALALIAYQMRFLIRQSFPDAGLAHFGVGVGIHSGPLTMHELGVAPFRHRVPGGHAVAVAALLAVKSKQLDWNVVCSEHTLASLGRDVKTGRHDRIGADWLQEPVSVAEVLVVREGEEVDADATLRLVRGGRSGYYKAFDPSLFAPGDGGLLIELPRVPGYRCLKPVGRGGMSSVFLAERLQDKAQMALKFAEGSVSEDSEVLHRFVEEYGLLEQVRHPHVLQIFDQGVTDDALFIVMEYLPGGTLKQRIGSQGLVQESAQRVLREMALALHEIHRAGIIHRDIKPENILLRGDGSAVLGDFGVARRLREARPVNQPDTVVATPYFMSPEQALGEAEDERTDIYSMGAVFYNMLTGHKPYQGATLESIVHQHLHADVPRLPAHLRCWQPLLDGMMAKRRERRYSAAMLLQHLETLPAPCA